MELLGQNNIDQRKRQVAILSQDSFYKVLTPEQKTKALKGQFNFDHPGNICVSFTSPSELGSGLWSKWLLCPLSFSIDAFDNDLVVETLCDIKEGKTVHIPVYDFVSHSRWVSSMISFLSSTSLFIAFWFPYFL